MKRLALVAALVAAFMMTAAPAFADHLDMETSVPESASPGDIISVQVVVRSAQDGSRVVGASVVALREVDLLGVSGDVELARATTDELGFAELRFQARAVSSEQIVVASLEGSTMEPTAVKVITVGSGEQLYQSSSGVQIPGFGAWVLVGLVVGIWAIIQFALLGPVEVARIAASEADAGGQE